jgi:acyl carrier protein
MDTNARVKKVLSKALIVDDSRVVDNALLADDLGINSVDRFELFMELEEEFGVEVVEEDLDGVKTVADVVQRVEQLTERQERHP